MDRFFTFPSFTFTQFDARQVPDLEEGRQVQGLDCHARGWPPAVLFSPL